MRKKIMITGASSGFGKAMAHRFAKEGWSIVITGRRKKILLELAEELTAQYGA
jgi:sulfoacetaldehyde reductase